MWLRKQALWRFFAAGDELRTVGVFVFFCVCVFAVFAFWGLLFAPACLLLFYFAIPSPFAFVAVMVYSVCC